MSAYQQHSKSDRVAVSKPFVREDVGSASSQDRYLYRDGYTLKDLELGATYPDDGEEHSASEIDIDGASSINDIKGERVPLTHPNGGLRTAPSTPTNWPQNGVPLGQASHSNSYFVSHGPSSDDGRLNRPLHHISDPRYTAFLKPSQVCRARASSSSSSSRSYLERRSGYRSPRLETETNLSSPGSDSTESAEEAQEIQNPPSISQDTTSFSGPSVYSFNVTDISRSGADQAQTHDYHDPGRTLQAPYPWTTWDRYNPREAAESTAKFD